MARSRVVGPDLPSGLRRPDRSVSLPSPELQRMGGLEEFLFWSRENPRPHGMSGEPRDVSKLSARARDWVESMGFDVDDLHEPMADDLEDMAEAEIAEGDSEVEFDRRQTERTGQIAEEIVRDRRQQVEDVEAAEAAWGDAERDASVGDPGWDGFPVAEMRGLGAELGGRLAGFPPTDMDTPLAPAEPPGQGIEDMESGVAAYPELPIGFMQGLTADQAFQQHHAMSSGEQPRSDRAHPERPTPPTSREPWVPLSDEQNAINAEGIEEARKTLNGSRNPELRAMDSQMMTDLMAERAAQPEQGYFGGMGNAVQELTETVRAMSGEEQGMMIAALIAAGLLTAGSGGMLAPAGAALMGGAGMAALSQ